MSPAYSGAFASEQSSRGAIAPAASDGLLATAAPIWQILIGGCVLLALIAASARLARRGRSRMTTALLVTGVAIIGLAVVGVLTSER
jgi:hypothetical protein